MPNPAVGMDEAAIGPIPAAVANAVFNLTGQRLRELPLRLEAAKVHSEGVGETKPLPRLRYERDARSWRQVSARRVQRCWARA